MNPLEFLQFFLGRSNLEWKKIKYYNSMKTRKYVQASCFYECEYVNSRKVPINNRGNWPNEPCHVLLHSQNQYDKPFEWPSLPHRAGSDLLLQILQKMNPKKVIQSLQFHNLVEPCGNLPNFVDFREEGHRALPVPHNTVLLCRYENGISCRDYIIPAWHHSKRPDDVPSQSMKNQIIRKRSRKTKTLKI